MLYFNTTLACLQHSHSAWGYRVGSVQFDFTTPPSRSFRVRRPPPQQLLTKAALLLAKLTIHCILVQISPP